MDKLWSVFANLLTNPLSLIIAGGIGLFFVGAVGQVPPYIPQLDMPIRILLMAAGAALAIVGIVLFVRAQRPTTRYGFRILSPQEGDDLPEAISIRGEMTEKVPKGKQLWLLRIYPRHDMFIPMQEVHVKADKSWEALGCHLGGEPTEYRFIGAYLLDDSAVALMDFFREVSAFHNDWMDRLNVPPNAKNRYVPPINVSPAKLTNMELLQEIRVKRK